MFDDWSSSVVEGCAVLVESWSMFTVVDCIEVVEKSAELNVGCSVVVKLSSEVVD